MYMLFYDSRIVHLYVCACVCVCIYILLWILFLHGCLHCFYWDNLFGFSIAKPVWPPSNMHYNTCKDSHRFFIHSLTWSLYFRRYCVKWMGPPLISQPTREYSKRWSQFMVTTCSHYCSVNVPLVRDEYQIQTEAVATFLPIFGACMISRFIIKVKTFVPLTWSCRSHWTYNDYFF